MTTEPLPVSIGVLSFSAHRTLEASLTTNIAAGVKDAASQFFVYFNKMQEADKAIAKRFGVAYAGSQDNTGIFGGFRAIASHATEPHVLILENDIFALPDADVRGCLAACLTDMKKYDIKVFSLRSRATPGQGDPWRKYVQCFEVHEPVNPAIAAAKPSITTRGKMLLKHGYLSKFRGRSVYVETSPDLAQPHAIKKLPSGNFVTDSRFYNWSNQAVLVERDFFLNVICRRVEEKPDPRLVHGHQDIERALNSLWWRRRREPMGHAAAGVFTHARLDR